MLTITQTENSASQTSHPQFLRAYFRQKEVLATHLHFWACWTCFDPLTRRSCLVRYQTFTRFVRETNERKKRVFQISKKEETDLILIWVSRPKSIQLRPPLSLPLSRDPWYARFNDRAVVVKRENCLICTKTWTFVYTVPRREISNGA